MLNERTTTANAQSGIQYCLHVPMTYAKAPYKTALQLSTLLVTNAWTRQVTQL